MLSQILIAAALATAQAPETEPTPEVETEHHEHAYRWLVATKIITGTSRAAHGNTDLFGPGVDLELTIWPQVGLELEFAAAFLLSEELHSVPMELLLKKAFHVDRRTDLFVAAGGVVNYVNRDEGGSVLLKGGIFTAGGYLWHSTQFGLVIELSYALYVLESRVEHDVEGAVGVAYRW